MESERSLRKMEHVRCALGIDEGKVPSSFDDVQLVHCALPNLAWEDIDTSVDVAGTRWTVPIFLNALTGGGTGTEEINAGLARTAQVLGIPMALGSQTTALADPIWRQTYQVVRKENPNGFLFANIGAHLDAKAAQEAVDMIGAQALQIHLNPVQELAMPEGDRDFRRYLEHIGNIVEACSVPVFVKEVGFGLSRSVVRDLARVRGLAGVDVGGTGGTNFAHVELARGRGLISSAMGSWGITTVASLCEAVQVANGLTVLATGGIKSGLDVARCLALGASAVGVAGMALRTLLEAGESELVEYLSEMVGDLRACCLLTGVHRAADLKKGPVVVNGSTGEWLRLRGIDLDEMARRDLA